MVVIDLCFVCPQYSQTPGDQGGVEEDTPVEEVAHEQLLPVDGPLEAIQEALSESTDDSPALLPLIPTPPRSAGDRYAPLIVTKLDHIAHAQIAAV